MRLASAFALAVLVGACSAPSGANRAAREEATPVPDPTKSPTSAGEPAAKSPASLPVEGAAPRAAAAEPAPAMTQDELLSRPGGAPFEVRVAAGERKSYLARLNCAYFEWAYGERREGKLVSYSVAYHSEDPVALLVDGRNVEVDTRRIRTYLSPVFEREYRSGDASAPKVMLQRLAEGEGSVWAEEYCLEVGKSYRAVVRVDSYHLPPEGPDDEPRTRTNRVLLLTDRAIVDGKPEGEPTPAYRGWSY